MRVPVLAVGDGALGFWKAVRDVFPQTGEQRCWWHRIGNVLAALPKSAHPGAKAAVAEIYNAADRKHAEVAAKAFAIDYGAKWPKAVGEDHRGPRHAAGVLRLPGRALDPPAHNQPDRVDLRHRPAPPARHQRPRLARGRRRDGVQAHRIRAGPLARSERTAPRGSRRRRRDLHQRQTRRTTRRIRRRSASRVTRPSTGLDYCSWPMTRSPSRIPS